MFEPGDFVTIKDEPSHQNWKRRYRMLDILEISHFDGYCYRFRNHEWKAMPDRLEKLEGGPW